MKKKQAVEISQKLIQDEEFKSRHRKSRTAFTRTRKLCFSFLIIVILRKSVKSSQLILNELTVSHGGDDDTVSSSAFTQARACLHHTAFIELCRKAVADVMYSDNNIKLYKGMRVLGIDGSKILLPDTPDIIKEFGLISYSNDHPDVKGSHACGPASVMYDVLNHVAPDSVSGTARACEAGLAIGHQAYSGENDLLLYDRNYPSYFHLAFLCLLKKNFVIRCSAASFAPARKMLNGEGPDSQIVTLKPATAILRKLKTMICLKN